MSASHASAAAGQPPGESRSIARPPCVGRGAYLRGWGEEVARITRAQVVEYWLTFFVPTVLATAAVAFIVIREILRGRRRRDGRDSGRE